MTFERRYILLITLSLFFLFESRAQEPFLPQPTGDYTIGTSQFFISDTLVDKRGNEKTVKKNHIKIWYPSDSIVDEKDYNLYLKGHKPKDLFKNFKLLGATKFEVNELCKLRTFSKSDLPFTKDDTKFPLIIFTPGCYFGMHDIYSAFIENLVSHGYIVCSIIHIHDQICIDSEGDENLKVERIRVLKSFYQWRKLDFFTLKNIRKEKNKEVLTHKILDKLTRFDAMLDQWENNSMELLVLLEELSQKNFNNNIYQKIYFSNIATMGHSLGGAVSNHMCVSNEKIKAGINIDCFQFGDVLDSQSSKPMMLIENDNLKKWQAANSYVYREIPNFKLLTIENSRHFVFCDLPFYDGIIPPSQMKIYLGNADARKAIETINKNTLGFFNKYLTN